MSAVLHAINKWARIQPHAPAVQGINITLSYKELYEAVCLLQDYLEQQQPAVIAVLMDNSPAWIVIDLAAQAANIPLLPIPAFFSSQQIEHTIKDTGCDLILTDQPERFAALYKEGVQANENLSALINDKGAIWEITLNQTDKPVLEQQTAKITYTSGTTGAPKGVCLRQSVIDCVALSLSKAVDMRATDRHLCALPLATLLENIAGVYLPLLAGAVVIVYPLAETGLQGATGFDAVKFYQVLTDTDASTTVLVPHFLQQLVEVCEQTHQPISSLRFVAVGGAPISLDLLERAQQCQLPVFEGYGLSECASVVAVNNIQCHRAGSVGKPLSHIDIKLANDGEILIKGARYTGYLGERADDSDYLATGDIGYLDKDGYLYVTGRKKNMFITAFGRNVSPDWVERELVLHAAIEQAAVFGEGRPWNVAVIAAAANCCRQEITEAIESVNQDLPDYARIRTWIAATEPFQINNQQLTATGRLRRHVIWQQYAEHIEDLYSTTNDLYRKTA